MFSKNDLIKDIKAMGILPSDKVIVHSSLRKVGKVEGGADTVIDAFKEVLSEGLFMVPTHTWDYICPENPVYDVRKTMPVIGALPCVAAFREDGIRSLHPTHSLWATGIGAKEFVAGEELGQTPTPPGSAWDRLAEIGAKILLIGVGNDKNTFIHSVEEVLDVPDRLNPENYQVTIIDRGGREYRHPMCGHRCSGSDDVSENFVNFEKAFVEMGVQTFGKLGNAEVRIVDAKKCKDLLIKIYSHADRDICIDKMDIPAEWYR